MRLPTIDANGVPFCSEDRCPSYDGKRCEEMGFRPGNICEPEVIDMAAELERLRERVAALEASE